MKTSDAECQSGGQGDGAGGGDSVGAGESSPGSFL